MVSLVEEGVDVAVRIGFLEDSSLRTRRVGQTRRVVVGSPAYLAKRRPRRPDDLKKHALIHFTSLGAAPEWRFTRGGREERVALQPRFVTNSADAAIEQAEGGGGLAMVRAYQVVDALRAGRIELVLTKYEPPPLPIQLLYPATRLVSANLRAFTELTLATRSWEFVKLPP